jgi:hypothetical protein
MSPAIQFYCLRLEHQFRGSLRRTHNACRIDRFVGRNHDTSFDIKFHRAFEQSSCTDNIVEHGFGRITFEQGNVFVSRSVEDHLWPIPVENLLQSSPHTQVADQWNDFNLPAFNHYAQFAFDLKDGVFVFIEQDN